MALIDCPDCGKQVSSNAPTCPNCGAPIATVLSPPEPTLAAATSATETQTTESRQVSFLLAAGIFWLPFIFAWFTLRKGYSTKARLISFAWLVVVFGWWGSDTSVPSDPSAWLEKQKSAPVREATQPVVDVTLRQLVEECEANQVAFEDNWKGKSVRVQGSIKEIDAGFSGGTLRLRKPGGSRWDSISALGIPRDVLGTLSKGDQVTLQCESVREVMGDPTLYDCSLPYR